MAMKPCRECKKEVAESAEKCPHCGVSAPAASPTVRAFASILTVIGLGALIWYLFLGGLEGSVASDFEKQYDIAKGSGDQMQMCVQAGLVAAAYLQAQNEASYRHWQSIEIADCSAAGVPK